MVFLRYSIRFLVKGQNDTERGRACLRALPLSVCEKEGGRLGQDNSCRIGSNCSNLCRSD